MDEIETLKSENAAYKKDTEEIVTVVFGLMDMLGMLDETKTTINPKFTGDKPENPMPYIMESIGRIAQLAMESKSGWPKMKERAAKELSKKTWVVDIALPMIPRYQKYNKLPEMLEKIEKQHAIQNAGSSK